MTCNGWLLSCFRRTETRGKLEDEEDAKKQKGRMESPRAWDWREVVADIGRREKR